MYVCVGGENRVFLPRLRLLGIRRGERQFFKWTRSCGARSLRRARSQRLLCISCAKSFRQRGSGCACRFFPPVEHFPFFISGNVWTSKSEKKTAQAVSWRVESGRAVWAADEREGRSIGHRLSSIDFHRSTFIDRLNRSTQSINSIDHRSTQSID